MTDAREALQAIIDRHSKLAEMDNWCAFCTEDAPCPDLVNAKAALDALKTADAAQAAEMQRLRDRIHEVQVNADRRNAELHRKVAYYESISNHAKPIIERIGGFRKEPIEGRTDAVTHHWDNLPHPGSMIGFWTAFQMALEAEAAQAERNEKIRQHAEAIRELSDEPHPAFDEDARWKHAEAILGLLAKPSHGSPPAKSHQCDECGETWSNTASRDRCAHGEPLATKTTTEPAQHSYYTNSESLTSCRMCGQLPETATRTCPGRPRGATTEPEDASVHDQRHDPEVNPIGARKNGPRRASVPSTEEES